MEAFGLNFRPQGVQSVLTTFHKNHYPATFAAILNFSVKQGICRVYWQLLEKIAFPPLLAAILNFCIKRKSTFISETVQDRAISTKFWTRRVSAECTGDILQKSLSRHFLVAILNFCVKRKTHLSGKPFKIVILRKFLTYRLSAECTGDFSQKSFSRHFWQPS